jgi:hypothetical protein
VDPERLLVWVDRLAAGRQATLRVDEVGRTDPRTDAAFTRVAWLLLAEFVVGGGALVEAVTLTRRGDVVPGRVWWRLLVIFGIATTLFYFVWRARLGYWWAYSRLRLFSLVFPLVAISTCLIPGLYPPWMIAEQVLFSAVLLVVRRVLSSAHLRSVYVRPARRPTSVPPVPPEPTVPPAR